MNIVKVMAVSALALLPGLAYADAVEDVKADGKLTIAFDPSVPPWSYKDDKLNYTGYEYLVAQKFAADNGLELEIVETNGANRIPLLLTNKVELVFAAMTITAERKEVIAFSLPYGGTQTAVSGPVDMTLSKAEDLAGQRIAVARGTVMDDQLTKIAPAGTEIVRFEDESTTLTSILSGQLQLVAQSTSLNKTIMQRDPSLKIEPKVILGTGMHGIGMAKDKPELKAWVDGWVKANMTDGTLQGFFEQVHEMPMPANVEEAAKNGIDQ